MIFSSLTADARGATSQANMEQALLEFVKRIQASLDAPAPRV